MDLSKASCFPWDAARLLAWDGSLGAQEPSSISRAEVWETVSPGGRGGKVDLFVCSSSSADNLLLRDIDPSEVKQFQSALHVPEPMSTRDHVESNRENVYLTAIKSVWLKITGMYLRFWASPTKASGEVN